jgi:hypothetical protein
MSDQVCDFDIRVDYCFREGYNAFHHGASESSPDLDPVTLAVYLARLFEKPGFVTQRYSDEQIANAIWYICGVGSCYFHEARDKVVPQEVQVRWVRALATFYSDLLDQVCNEHGACPDVELIDSRPVDMAVFMIWDMDCLQGAAMFPGYEHLVDPIFSVLESVLTLRTSSCLASALHGLGHLQMNHARRVAKIIGRFNARRRDIPDWPRDYAQQAKSGSVQ